MNLAHLARRFVGSLSRREPEAADLRWVHTQLQPAEANLWERMSVQDRRHSIEVARRFHHLLPDATSEELAAALLHDVGKLEAGLGTVARVIATVVGPRTARFQRYHDHERIGAGMLEQAGSAGTTVALVRRSGRLEAVAALAAADHV